MKHLIEVVFFISLIAIFYHHIGYIILLKFFSTGKPDVAPYPAKTLNKFVFVIPMYNEAVFIEKKIESFLRNPQQVEGANRQASADIVLSQSPTSAPAQTSITAPESPLSRV